MKKIFSKAVLLTLFLIVLLAYPTFVVSADKSMKIIFGFWEPPVSQFAPAMKAWAKEMEERTNGKVKVEISWGGALGKPGEFLQLVEKGIVDMGMMVASFDGPGQFPMMEIIELPFVIPKAVFSTEALSRLYDKGLLDKKLDEVVVVNFVSGQGDPLFTKDKPVTTLQDVKGMKILATGPIAQHKVKLLGAIPVGLPIPEIYSALSKGIIDGYLFGYNGMAVMRFNEVTKYATFPATGTIGSAIIMNKKTFNKLPPEGQAMIQETRKKYSIAYGQGWDNICEKGRDLFLKSGGKEITWTPDSLEEINEIEAQLWNKWIADKEKMGLPAREAINFLYNFLKERGVEPPAIGYSLE